jgi:hypothetical protein
MTNTLPRCCSAPTRSSLGADATEVVTVRSLTKRLGDVVAVDDLTFPSMRAPSRDYSVRTARGRRPRFGYCLGLAEPTAGEALVLRPPVRLTGSAVGRPGELFVNFWPQNVHTACVRPNPHSLFPAVCMAVCSVRAQSFSPSLPNSRSGTA